MARPAKSLQDASFLTAALEGLELQRKRIDEQITHVRAMLGGRQTKFGAASRSGKPARKRLLSPEARKRIANAQKRRWAEYRKKQSSQG